MERFYERLTAYGENGLYPLHMPGHKRNVELFPPVRPYAIDITEIDGFDDLHHANGPLLETMERAAQLYGSKQAYLLVNGSTGGILAALSALLDRGDEAVVARNCHLSVYHALELRGANPIYLYPETLPRYGILGGISPEQVEEALRENPNAKCVVITSPTYEGVVSRVKEIADAAHGRGIPLIVDEAHGAHFGFHKAFPPSSASSHADVVISGLHKTLPAFTQSALLHVNGDLVSSESVERYLSIYQSSSPSYLLLYGMDRCLWFLQEGSLYFEAYVGRLQKLYRSLEGLEHLGLFHGVKGVERDCSKLVVSTKGTGLLGRGLFQRLRNEYGFQLEMAAMDYVIAMTSVCDTEEALERFAKALLAIDRELDDAADEGEAYAVARPLVRLSPYEARRRQGVVLALSQCAGRVAKETLYAYPPGIPIVVAGEEVGEECLALIRRYQERGIEIKGFRNGGRGALEVTVR